MEGGHRRQRIGHGRDEPVPKGGSELQIADLKLTIKWRSFESWTPSTVRARHNDGVDVRQQESLDSTRRTQETRSGSRQLQNALFTSPV